LLLEESFFPVCSPALVEGGDHPLRSPGDLKYQTLLHEEVDVSIPGYIDWPRWLAIAGIRDVDPRRGPRFTHTFMTLQAAAAGQGVALATSVLIGDDLRTGRLVCPFGPEIPGRYSYYLVSPPAALGKPKVSAFRSWIKAAANASPAAADQGRS
jgi:LysR family glycine cleavage system transcriptional activator